MDSMKRRFNKTFHSNQNLGVDAPKQIEPPKAWTGEMLVVLTQEDFNMPTKDMQKKWKRAVQDAQLIEEQQEQAGAQKGFASNLGEPRQCSTTKKVMIASAAIGIPLFIFPLLWIVSIPMAWPYLKASSRPKIAHSHGAHYDSHFYGSKAQRIEHELGGKLKVFPENDIALSQFETYDGAPWKINTVYRCHPLKPKLFMTLTMFQKNLRVEKKLEFLEFCKRLGARTVKVASGEQTKKEQMFMNRGMAEEEKIEMCLSHPVGLPRGLDPTETTWIRTEPTWLDMQRARLRDLNLLSYEVDYSFEQDWGVNPGAACKLIGLDLDVGEGKVESSSIFKHTVQVQFFTGAEYTSFQIENVRRWSSEDVTKFLDSIKVSRDVIGSRFRDLDGSDMVLWDEEMLFQDYGLERKWVKKICSGIQHLLSDYSCTHPARHLWDGNMLLCELCRARLLSYTLPDSNYGAPLYMDTSPYPSYNYPPRDPNIPQMPPAQTPSYYYSYPPPPSSFSPYMQNPSPEYVYCYGPSYGYAPPPGSQQQLPAAAGGGGGGGGPYELKPPGSQTQLPPPAAPFPEQTPVVHLPEPQI